MNRINKNTQNRYLRETPLLDFSEPSIQALVEEHGWRALPEYDRIGAVYTFVRDKIRFGYNVGDAIPASRVLRDEYGQCNTKGILLMALLRAVDISCRTHGFAINKKLQKGAMTGLVYRSAPIEIFHSWVEVWYDARWVTLEGFILDKTYLSALQRRFSACRGVFCGYGVAVRDFRHPPIEWRGKDTFIQNEGIVRDFGVYDCPDDLFHAHQQLLSPIKAFLYCHLGRRFMNRNVQRIRRQTDHDKED